VLSYGRLELSRAGHLAESRREREIKMAETLAPSYASTHLPLGDLDAADAAATVPVKQFKKVTFDLSSCNLRM
jgi:hypothetical protein